MSNICGWIIWHCSVRASVSFTSAADKTQHATFNIDKYAMF